MSHQIYNIIKDTEISERKNNRIMQLKSTITEIKKKRNNHLKDITANLS